MGPVGFEPTTKGLWVPCSNPWATGPLFNLLKIIIFQIVQQVNSFLSTFLNLVGKAGLEPATKGLWVLCSLRLSYSPLFVYWSSLCYKLYNKSTVFFQPFHNICNIFNLYGTIFFWDGDVLTSPSQCRPQTPLTSSAAALFIPPFQAAFKVL